MTARDFETLVWNRRTVRAFSAAPVPRSALEFMCRAARQAPSGANLQPGSFHVLGGADFEGLKAALRAAIAQGVPSAEEYSYFPQPMPPALKARQRAAGYALYNALGIERRDLVGRKRQFDRNYEFFGAPVGVVVTIHSQMGDGCYMDLGMSLMNFFLAAEAQGFATAGIGALAMYAPVVHDFLGLPADERVVCGIAVGVADQDAAVNAVRTEREPLDSFTTFRGV